MQNALVQSWWMWMIRGVIALIFGVMAFTMPVVTFGALITLFAAFMFVDGVFALGSLLFKRQQERPWWSSLLEGIFGIGIGLLTFFMPGITSLVFVTYIAIWAIATGILELVTAVRLRKEIEGEWAMGLAGILSIVLGFAFILVPGNGVVTIAWMLGAYAIAFGILMFTVGGRLRQLAHGSGHGDTMRHA